MKSAELKVQEWNCNVAATYSNSKHMAWQMILNGNVGLKDYIKNSWGISTEGCFLLLAPLPVLPMLFIVVNSPNLSD